MRTKKAWSPRLVLTLLGEWIEAERMARQQTMEAAAEACGVCQTTLAAVGTGRAGMTPRVASALGRYLRVPPEMVRVLAGVRAAAPGPPHRVDHRTAGRQTVLGQALERERRSRRQTMVQAAEAVGIHTGTLLSVKTGLHRLFAATRGRVAAYLGVPVATVAAWEDVPAEPLLPFETWLGWKLHPTVRGKSRSGEGATCERCVFLAGCREDVARGDFAWCEDAIPEDLVAGEPEAEWEESYV